MLLLIIIGMDLLGKEHEEMVAVASLEDRLRCVAVELDHLKHKSSDSLSMFVNSPSNFESTFIEIVFPDRKNLIVGCVYRHPSSKMSIKDFSSDHLFSTTKTGPDHDRI